MERKADPTQDPAGAILTERDALTLSLDTVDVPSQPFLESQLHPESLGAEAVEPKGFARRLEALKMRTGAQPQALFEAARRLPRAFPLDKLPEEIRGSLVTLKPAKRSFHGARFSLAYFPGSLFRSPCANKFGYKSTNSTRTATRLNFDVVNRGLLMDLGAQMASPSGVAVDAAIPAGFTYVGQFVDHDVTFDISSSLDVSTDANTIHNMRSPALDLDSVYGRGPALDPFLYDIPTTGNPTAIKLQLGTNQPTEEGGPGGVAGFSGLIAQTDFDVPRMLAQPHTAVIGDPRNDENLIVSQFHHAMLRFHNAVVDFLEAAAVPGDLFIEAKRIVTHHYQWAVMNDFLQRVCGSTAVNAALALPVGIGSAFRMPVEFSVAAYRFGHSMIRHQYWLSFVQPEASLQDIFTFNRMPNVPVLSNWVVDFNAFFETGVPVPVFNNAAQIDSALANGLAALPGFEGLAAHLAHLAQRNLLRGLALGLPSGQGMANQFGITPMTSTELETGLPAAEVDVLRRHGNRLLNQTPLWYYVLREAKVLEGGERLGPVGARIVAETFATMLLRDADSYKNAGGFTPFLPSKVAGDFTFADLMIFAGVHQP
jgi:hypothetical protein